MSSNPNKTKVGRASPTNLAIFPMDQNAKERVLTSLSVEEFKQNRLERACAIMTLLELLLKEIDRMESLASQLSPTPPEVINEMVVMRKAVEELYLILGDSFRWI